jgi:hypothetical protein
MGKGFVGATLGGPGGMTWECVHEDLGGPTTTPLNVRAACEDSFEERPISAREVKPDEPFSWRCFTLPSAASGGPPDTATEEQLEIKRQKLQLQLEGDIEKVRKDLLKQLIFNSMSLNLKVISPGTFEATVAFEGSGGGGAGARAGGAVIVAKLTKKIARGGTFNLRIPTTRAGAALVGKLAASGRSYRRKHPHGNKPPSARLRLTISFQRAAATDGKRLQVSRVLSVTD